MATWHLHLMGVANVSGPAQSGVRLPGGLIRVLLGRLALAGRGGCSRDLLCETLWPEGDSASTRHRLRVALLALRRFLQQAGPDVDTVLRADRTAIWLDFDACSSDVAAFEAALRQGDWTRADALYAGDLLSDCDEPTITSERERLCLAHRNVLRQLAETSERSGDLHLALYTAERLAALEPLDETAITLLIRLLSQAGHDVAARRRYRKLRRDYLKANDGTPLPRAIRARIQVYLAETAASPVPPRPAPSPPLSPSPPATFNRFFGRDREMGALRALLNDRHHRLVTATGPGGSGKTRLAIAVGGDLAGESFFVGLADTGDARRIGDKIVEALRLPRDLKVPPLEQVVQALNQRAGTPLLLLDNLEHLLGQELTRDVVRALLAGAPDLRILATSRQPLVSLPSIKGWD